MSMIEEIDKAIGAHGKWKGRLRTAIDTKSSDFKPEIVKTDNNCDFGKWLYGPTISSEIKNTQMYREIVKNHALFHGEAGRILQLALQGNIEEAEKGLSVGSTFSSLSSNLTKLMMDWKKTF